MAGSRRRRRLRRQRARAAAAVRDLPPEPTPKPEPERVSILDHLPPDLLAEIHRRVDAFRDRFYFALACSASGHPFTPEAPWLVLPGKGQEWVTLLSIANDEDIVNVRTSAPAMRDYVVVGSSGGLLVTADALGALRMVNPVTGAQADLPAITASPVFHSPFCIDSDAFLEIRYGGLPPPVSMGRTMTLAAFQMRQWFYRKVVLSASSCPGNYAAMLITGETFGVPAFVSSEDAVWRMAPSYDGVEDAIHHDGRFYSVTYTGDVEAWDRNVETGEFTSTVVAPRLAIDDVNKPQRKYLAAAMDGRLMAVIKYSRVVEQVSYHYGHRSCEKVTQVFFKVWILDKERRRWEEEEDIGDAAIFVGVNGSLCVSTTEYPRIRAGCIYFTDDDLGEASLRRHGNQGCSYMYDGRDDDELRFIGKYSLENDMAETIHELAHHRCWPPAAWIKPSVL
ncbi:hypothetical protein ACP70R_009248 [Stipagrostis hirtigluma subsp. patula]